MYKRFEIKDLNEMFDNDSRSFDDSSFKAEYKKINKVIKEIVVSSSPLDGSIIQDEWFPEFEYDVFISHSHKDEILAKKFSNWLLSNFGIKAFVDSLIWGNANQLRDELNLKHSFKGTDAKGCTTFDHKKCNVTSDHVNMILNNALMKMIDKTECFIFINSSNSLGFVEGLENPKLFSPWLFAEIAMSKYGRIRSLERHRDKKIVKSLEFKDGADDLEIYYPYNNDHLSTISKSDLSKLLGMKDKGKYAVLDCLYQIRKD